MEINDKLKTISQKVQKLGTENNRLTTELQRLQVERDVMRNKIREHEAAIAQLESKNVNLQIAKKSADEQKSAQLLRKKIDTYIREIDKCIELLNS